MTTNEAKKKALEALRMSMDKKHGKGTVQFLTGSEVSQMERLSSGCASLDQALGGGYPWGRIVELMGMESSGKTTVTLEAISRAQSEGKTAAFIDAEHALDLTYAQNLGVKLDELIFHQPESAEQALEVAADLADSGLVDIIVIDSVAALTPKAELEGEMTDNQMGLQARLMGKFLRKVAGNARKNNVLIFFINQIRMKVGVMFGNPEVSPGGNALKFYSSIRMKIARTGTQKTDGESIANDTKVTVIKNKTAPPYRVAEFQIKFGEGIDKMLDLLRTAVAAGVVQKTGAWYSLGNDRLGQGEQNVSAILKENDELRNKILASLKEDKNGLPARDNDV